MADFQNAAGLSSQEAEFMKKVLAQRDLYEELQGWGGGRAVGAGLPKQRVLVTSRNYRRGLHINTRQDHPFSLSHSDSQGELWQPSDLVTMVDVCSQSG